MAQMNYDYRPASRVRPTLAQRTEVLDIYGKRCLLHDLEITSGLVIDLHHPDEFSSHINRKTRPAKGVSEISNSPQFGPRQ